MSRWWRLPARWVGVALVVFMLYEFWLPPILAQELPGVDPPVVTPSPVTWPQMALVPIAGGLTDPTQVTNAGDGSGRLFVVEQAGRIRIIQAGRTAERPFLDISGQVNCCDGERGLLSMAFPPGFAIKRYFYVDYTARNGDVTVSRYHVSGDANLANPDSEEVLLRIPHPRPIHNGGQLAFNPRDGYLYISVGDGGIYGDPEHWANNPGQWYGKILRIDSETEGPRAYAIPPTNPYTVTNQARPEVWVVGLRNPWRFSFDRLTGDLYIADVGDAHYEEIDFEPASSLGGKNYGWSTLEGTRCWWETGCDTTGLTSPIWEYTHDDGNCAIAGGFVDRSRQYPRLFGIYLYGDFCSGRIWALQFANDQWQNKELGRLPPMSITGFGEDESGSVYVVDHAAGQVYKITDRVQ